MSNKTAFKCLNLGRHILLMRSKSHSLACIPRINSIKSYRVTCYDSQTCRGRNLLILRLSVYTTLYYIVGMWYVTAWARRFATTVLHLYIVYPVRREKTNPSRRTDITKHLFVPFDFYRHYICIYNMYFSSPKTTRHND